MTYLQLGCVESRLGWYSAKQISRRLHMYSCTAVEFAYEKP